MSDTFPKRGAARISFDIIAMICGTIVLYACGVTWLKILTGMTWSKTLAVGMLPFLIGDALKIVAAAAIARAIRPIIRVTGNGVIKVHHGKHGISLNNNNKQLLRKRDQELPSDQSEI